MRRLSIFRCASMPWGGIPPGPRCVSPGECRAQRVTRCTHPHAAAEAPAAWPPSLGMRGRPPMPAQSGRCHVRAGQEQEESHTSCKPAPTRRTVQAPSRLESRATRRRRSLLSSSAVPFASCLCAASDTGASMNKGRVTCTSASLLRSSRSPWARRSSSNSRKSCKQCSPRALACGGAQGKA